MSADRKILIVDSDVEQCSLMRAVISGYKFDFPTEVYTASDLNDAACLVKQVSPDLIICGCGVRDFVPWAQGLNSDAVKVLLSDNADFDELQLAVNKGGAFRFVFKPWTEDELCGAISGSIEYLDISRENSGLVAKAEAKNRYLMKLKSMLENKDAEQDTRIERSEQTVKNMKTEFEIINRLLRAMNNVKSTADIEKKLKEILYDAIDVEDVKISPYRKAAGNSTGSADGISNGSVEKSISIPLFCSGCLLGEVSFYRSQIFCSSEVELLDKTADIVAMTADKLIRFSSLERLKKQWEAVFDSIDVPLTVVDKDLNLTRANVSFGKMVGEKVQNIIGKKCFNVLRNIGNGTQCPGCNVKECFDTAKPVGSEINVEHSGKCFTTWTYPVSTDGRVTSAVQFYKDISEQKNYREKLLHSEKLAEIGILAGSVAHEVNNPIGGIIAMLQIIEHDVDKNSTLYEDIQEMKKAAERCKKIVDNLLHFSRQSKEDEARVMELSSVFSTLMPLVDIQIRHEKIDFSFVDETNGAKIKAVFNEIVQAVLNVINTSVELIAKKQTQGVINVKAYADSCATDKNLNPACENARPCVHIEITDNGAPAEGLNSDFRNLALFVTERVVKNSGGDIEIKKTEPEGNHYRLSFPLCK